MGQGEGAHRRPGRPDQRGARRRCRCRCSASPSRPRRATSPRRRRTSPSPARSARPAAQRFRGYGSHAGRRRPPGAARGHLRADPARRDGDAQPRAEGRRAGLARGGDREPAQARTRRREDRLRPPRRRRHHRERRAAGRGLQRHDHRLQRPPGPARARAGGDPRRRDPDLRDHLQARRGHRGGDGRHARARRSRRSSPARPRSARSSACRASVRSPAATCATGTITRGSKVRFLRDGVVIWKGAISSLRRFKDDVREVQTGFECGIGLTDFQDLQARATSSRPTRSARSRRRSWRAREDGARRRTPARCGSTRCCGRWWPRSSSGWPTPTSACAW